MLYRIYCPVCNKTINDSVVKPIKCPWTHTHEVQVETMDAYYGRMLLWQGLALSLGANPYQFGRAVNINK